MLNSYEIIKSRRRKVLEGRIATSLRPACIRMLFPCKEIEGDGKGGRIQL